MQIEISWQDVEGLENFSSAIRKIQSQDQFGNAARRAINRTGDMARTQVVRALAKQTGLKQKLIRKAIKVKRANYDSFQYEMKTRGGNISLKYFSPRETRSGVSAKLPTGRKIFAGTFIKGGSFPNRVKIGFGGHVMRRKGRDRFPVERIKSGIIIPHEMVRGETAQAFHIAVKTNLTRRFDHEISRLSGKVFS